MTPYGDLCVDISSGDGLVPDDTKTFPDPMYSLENNFTSAHELNL